MSSMTYRWLVLCYSDLFLYGNNVMYVRDLACVLFHNVLTSAVVLTYCVYRRCVVWRGAGGLEGPVVRDVSSVLYLRLWTWLLCS
jgi:hypothetical protein